MELDNRIKDAAETLSETAEVEGLYLAGSFGRGTADAWSDVDLIALAAPDAHRTVAEQWLSILSGQTQIVHRMERFGTGSLLNVVTEEWLRIDLLMLAPDAFARGRAQDMLRPLHDPSGRHAALPATLPPARPDPKRVARLTGEFLRVLGLLRVGAGRTETVLLVRGLGLLRDMLGDLMLERCTQADRGGVLHPSRLLSPEDMAVLRRLSYPGPDLPALIEAHIEIANLFLPRARALSAETGAEWPDAFVAATRAALERDLGMTFRALP